MNAQDAIEQIKTLNSPVVTIFPGHRVQSHTRAMFSTADVFDNIDQVKAEDAAAAVQEFANALYPGRYTLRLKKNMKGGAGERELHFEIPVNSPAPAVVSGPAQMPGNMDISGLVNSQVQAQVGVLRAEIEKERYLDRIAALEKEIEDANSWQPKMNFLAEKLVEAFLKRNGVNGEFHYPVTEESVNGHHHDEKPEGVSQEDWDEAVRGNNIVNQSIETMVDKLGTDTPELLKKLADIPADKLEALANLPPDRINQLTQFI